MSTAEVKTRYTPDDLLTMPDGDRYELVDGQLVEHVMSFWSSYVARKLIKLFDQYGDVERLGWVLGEGTTYQCFRDAPQRVRKADVSFIRLERLSAEEALAEGHTLIAPDLAVEVISPNDIAYELDRKVREFLDAGVRLVWVINPETRTVAVHRLHGTGTILRDNDELSGEDVIPGFRCGVAELFHPPTPAAQPSEPPGERGQGL